MMNDIEVKGKASIRKPVVNTIIHHWILSPYNSNAAITITRATTATWNQQTTPRKNGAKTNTIPGLYYVAVVKKNYP